MASCKVSRGKLARGGPKSGDSLYGMMLGNGTGAICMPRLIIIVHSCGLWAQTISNSPEVEFRLIKPFEGCVLKLVGDMTLALAPANGDMVGTMDRQEREPPGDGFVALGDPNELDTSIIIDLDSRLDNLRYCTQNMTDLWHPILWPKYVDGRYVLLSSPFVISSQNATGGCLQHGHVSLGAGVTLVPRTEASAGHAAAIPAARWCQLQRGDQRLAS